MKAWMLLPFALILGWMLGGWLPKAELSLAREELAAARLALKARAPRRAGFTGVTGMLGIPETESADHAVPPPHEPDAPPVTPPDAVADEPAAGVEVAPTGDTAADASMKHGIEQAMEVWEARSDIARATFIDNAALDQAHANRFDVLVAAMNIRLAHSIEQFVEQVKRGEPVGEEQTIKLMRDLTTSVAETYDKFDESMPPNWRADAGDAFKVTDFIDPSVAMPLVDIEDDLDAGMFGN